MKPCEACGGPKAQVVVGGVMLCRTCEPAFQKAIEELRAAGKPVNALKVAQNLFPGRSGKHYLLRDVPFPLWTTAKHRAIEEGVSMRDLLLAALRKYLG